MSTQISPQMRIVALAGVLLIALAGSGLLLLRHSKPGAVTVPSTSHSTTPAATTALHRPAASKPAVHVRVMRPKVDPRLPAPLRSALARHPLVVVGLYDPQVRVDSLSLAEARAGASAARVGFVPVNLLDDAVAGPLTALLPANQLLPAPGLLVYRRPGRLVYRFDGYLDRAAVTQAVRNAR